MPTPDAPAGVSVIAEIGSNYDGDLSLARDYIRACRAAGATAVKFQTLKKEKLIAAKIQSDGQWLDNPLFGKFGNLELPDEWHHALKAEADAVGIEFLSTPFYLEAVDLLESVGVSQYKIASGDITFVPLLERVGATRKSVLLSTGASSLPEIERAMDVLSKAGASRVVLLHCVSRYPPEWQEMNLRAIQTLQREFGVPVGISDHTPGWMIPVAAVVLGATVIEKHVTFDRNRTGPDHPYALTVPEFGEMVQAVSRMQLALGSGDKTPSPSELPVQRRIRRGIYHPVTMESSTDRCGIWLRPEPGERS